MKTDGLYHWGVPKQDQQHLSLASQLEGVLRFGSWDELMAHIHKHFMVSYWVFRTRTSRDLMIADKRKKLLQFVFSTMAEKYGYTLE